MIEVVLLRIDYFFATSHSLDYLRWFHWLLSSESSTPLLASSPTSDLATMSAMFCVIYIGSHAIREWISYKVCLDHDVFNISTQQQRHTWLAWSRASPIFQVGVISILPRMDCLTYLALGLCLDPGLSLSLARWPRMVSLSMFEPFVTLSHLNPVAAPEIKCYQVIRGVARVFGARGAYFRLAPPPPKKKIL